MAAVKQPIVPKKEALLAMPVSVKFTTVTLQRIDRVVNATGNSRNATINHLVSWALTEWEHQQVEEKVVEKMLTKPKR